MLVARQHHNVVLELDNLVPDEVQELGLVRDDCDLEGLADLAHDVFEENCQQGLVGQPIGFLRCVVDLEGDVGAGAQDLLHDIPELLDVRVGLVAAVLRQHTQLDFLVGARAVHWHT